MILAAAAVAWQLAGLPVTGADATGGAAGAPAATAEETLVLSVRIQPGLPFRNFDPALLGHLRAELAASHVTVLREGTDNGLAPSARLIVAPAEGVGRLLSLEVQYLRSGTVVQRQLDLSALPDDGAVLAVAVAVDELIRATGALGGVPPPPSPAALVLAVAPSPRPAPRAEVRAMISGERQRDGTLTLGPDAVVAWLVGARLSLDVRVGWRNAGTRAAPDGAIDTSAVVGGVGGAVALLGGGPGRRAGADLQLRVDGAWVSMHGTAGVGAAGFDTGAFGVAAVAGAGGWVTLVPPLSLVVFAGWQVPLRTVTATDGSRTAAVVYAPGLTAAAGIGARF